jgi:multiple sugar transport system ATP-binding protein
MGMVFQAYSLFPNLTVAENVAFGLRVRGRDKGERRGRATELLDLVGLADRAQRYPHQLSGGQQQRVALARALAVAPQVLLLDEPLSALDAQVRVQLREEIRRIQLELGITTVFVTHDQAEALALADRIAVMEGGRIRQVGTPTEVFRHPANTFVAGFIGSTPMNLVPARVHGDELAVAGVRLPVPEEVRGRLTDGEQVVYGVRPEYLDYAADPVPAALTGQVVVVENLGSFSLVSLDVPGEDDTTASVQVVVPEGREPEPGDTGWVVPRPGRSLVYRDGELVGGTAPPVPAPRTGVGADA